MVYGDHQMLLAHWTAMLQECLACAPGETETRHVVRKELAHTLPYRWEVHAESGHLGEVVLDPEEVLDLRSRSESDLRDYLALKLSAALKAA